MAAPSVAGITILGTFETGLQTGTKINSGGSPSAIFVNDATINAQKVGIDGGLCSSLNLEAFGGTYGAVRHTHANLQAGAPTTRDFSATKFIWHFSTDLLSQLDTRANGGYRLRIYSNTGFTIYRDYNIQGNDSNYTASSATKKNPEAWRSIIIDLTDASLATTTVGAFSATTIAAIECQMNPASSTSVVSTWHDRYASCNGLTLTAGDNVTPGTFNTFYTYSDVTNFLFLMPNVGGAYAPKMPLTIGNGSTATRFDDTDKYIEFAKVDTTSSNPQLTILPTNFLGLFINQSASDYFRSIRITYRSDSKWQLNITGSTSATFIWTGGVVSNVGTNSIGGAASFSGVIFSGCDRLNFTASRSITSCTITASTDTVAAMDWLSTHTITGTSFTSNTTPAGALRINTAGTYNLSANTFTGNTKNFNITATTGTVTIVVDAASTSDVAWASSYVTAGATVVIQIASASITLSGLIAGTEIRVYDAGTTTEIAGIESSDTSFTFTPTGYSNVDIAILSDIYKNRYIANYPVPGTNTTIPIEQSTDINYLNP